MLNTVETKTASELAIEKFEKLIKEGKTLTAEQQIEFKKAKASVASKRSRSGQTSASGAFAGILNTQKDAKQLALEKLVRVLNYSGLSVTEGVEVLENLVKICKTGKK